MSEMAAPFDRARVDERGEPVAATHTTRGTGNRDVVLTVCSRQDDTGWQRTTPDDTGRHVDARSVPGRSNLRIRCPKGRGSSTLPSRTTSDLRIFCSSLYRQSARETFLLTLAHRTSANRWLSAPCDNLHMKLRRETRILKDKRSPPYGGRRPRSTRTMTTDV